MRFTTALVLATAASVGAYEPKADLSAESVAGKRLLAKARKLDQVSGGWNYGYYGNGNYNNANYNGNYNNGNYNNGNYNQDEDQQQDNQNYNNNNYNQNNQNNGNNQNNQNNGNNQNNQNNNGQGDDNQNQNGDDAQGEYNEEGYDYENYYDEKSSSNAESSSSSSAANSNWGLDMDSSSDLSWMPGYSIKFDGCANEKVSGSSSQRLLAKFKLCPASASCSECKNGGEYIVPMSEFVFAMEDVVNNGDQCAYQQKQCSQQCQEEEEYQQYNDDANNEEEAEEQGEEEEQDDQYQAQDQDCYTQCMANAGMQGCKSNADMVSCHRMGYMNDKGEPYYVGGACKHGGVYLQTFTDSSCSKPAAEGTYKALTGSSLAEENLVSSECVGCGSSSQGNNQNYQNDAQGGSSTGICRALYSDAGKCEAKMEDLTFKNNGACDYIHGALVRMNRNGMDYFLLTLKHLAWIVAVGVFAYLGYKCYLRRRHIQANKTPLIPEKSLDEPQESASVQHSQAPAEESPTTELKPATVV